MFRVMTYLHHSSQIPKLAGILAPYVGEKKIGKKYNGAELVRVSSSRKVVAADAALLQELHLYGAELRSSVVVDFNKSALSLLASSAHDVMDYCPSFSATICMTLSGVPASAKVNTTVDKLSYHPDVDWVVSPVISGQFNDEVFCSALDVGLSFQDRVDFLKSMTGASVVFTSGGCNVTFPGLLTTKQQLCLMAKLGLVALSIGSTSKLVGSDVILNLPLAV